MNASRTNKARGDSSKAEELLRIAERLEPAPKVKLGPYHEVIRELLRKEFTYAAISDFLTKHIGRRVSRSQVFGFVKRNPGVFDDEVRQRLGERFQKFSVEVREADEPLRPEGDVVVWREIVKAPRFLHRLPQGKYVARSGELFRVEEKETGEELVLVRRIPPSAGAEWHSQEPKVFILGIYRGMKIETA